MKIKGTRRNKKNNRSLTKINTNEARGSEIIGEHGTTKALKKNNTSVRIEYRILQHTTVHYCTFLITVCCA